MPVINEERHLQAAVAQVLDQDYDGQLEVVIAVAASTDRTAEVAAALANQDTRVRVVGNPTGATPAGLNAAIGACSGDVVVRVDGHAIIPRDYVRTAVRILQQTGADNVGGIMAAEGTTPFESAVARAMTSRFGVGGAAFHIGGQAGPALTVYLGCFQRAALERVGGFDESMVRAQDWELNLRIRSTGGVVWFTPELQVTYRPRGSLRALARQYHDYGRWRREVANRHPSTLSVRYLAAPIAVLAMALGVLTGGLAWLLGLDWAWLGLLPLSAYLVGDLLASATSALKSPRAGLREAFWLPLVFPAMHIPWGLGFLRGPR
jgi:glycosyltransferase involved in cell wall biosynthesis